MIDITEANDKNIMFIHVINQTTAWILIFKQELIEFHN